MVRVPQRSGTYRNPEVAQIIKRTMFSETQKTYTEKAVDKVRKVDQCLHIMFNYYLVNKSSQEV